MGLLLGLGESAFRDQFLNEIEKLCAIISTCSRATDAFAQRTPNCVIARCKNGKKKKLPSKVTTTLKEGDKVVIVTPGGGGWGKPAKRLPECVAKDVREGFICSKRAKEVYGMAFDKNIVSAAREKTKKQRSSAKSI